jgi:hypothetical protein
MSTDAEPESHFEKLPAELRDEIYDLAAEDVHTVFIVSRNKKYAISKHPLSKVSRQLREEFGARLLAKAATPPYMPVVAKIVDLDFDAFLTFLKMATGKDDATRMRFGRGMGEKMLRMDMVITADWEPVLERDSFTKMVKWLRSAVKKGQIQISPQDIEYVVERVDVLSNGKVHPALCRKGLDGDGWWGPVQRAIDRFLEYGVSDEQQAAAIQQKRYTDEMDHVSRKLGKQMRKRLNQ